MGESEDEEAIAPLPKIEDSDDEDKKEENGDDEKQEKPGCKDEKTNEKPKTNGDSKNQEKSKTGGESSDEEDIKQMKANLQKWRKNKLETEMKKLKEKQAKEIE